MTRRPDSLNLSLCFLCYSFETEYEKIEEDILSMVIHLLDYRSSIECLYEYSYRMAIIVEEANMRRILNRQLHRKDIAVRSFDHNYAEYIPRDIPSKKVSFAEMGRLYNYVEQDPCYDIFLFSVKELRNENAIMVRSRTNTFGKDTTSIYNWIYNPSFSFLHTFLML